MRPSSNSTSYFQPKLFNLFTSCNFLGVPFGLSVSQTIFHLYQTIFCTVNASSFIVTSFPVHILTNISHFLFCSVVGLNLFIKYIQASAMSST